MDLNDLPIFAMMTKRMAWLTKRQEVLAQNIANSDTPGFRPSDLMAQKFRGMLRSASGASMELRQTNSGHMAHSKRSRAFREEKQKETYETSPDGNAVVLEEQLMKVSETQGNYRLATNLYRKHVRMIKAALGRDR